MAHTSKTHISVIGDVFVGKTAISNAFADQKNKFVEDYRPTCGTSMMRVTYKNRELILWDTSGMERYKSLAPVYYRDSKAALIVYDITNRNSFQNLDEWFNRYVSITSKSVSSNTITQDSIPISSNPVIIIGNKLDMKENAVITEEEGREWAEKHHCSFTQVSAKTGVNLESILELLVNKVPEPTPNDANPFKSGSEIGDKSVDQKSNSYCC